MTSIEVAVIAFGFPAALVLAIVLGNEQANRRVRVMKRRWNCHILGLHEWGPWRVHQCQSTDGSIVTGLGLPLCDVCGAIWNGQDRRLPSRSPQDERGGPSE